LLKYYRQGLIIYPRTESNYINDKKLLSYNPHPPLSIVNKFCEPLREQYYKLDSNSIFLHFHNIRALTPSNYERTQKKIKKIITEKNDIKRIVENYDEFLGAQNIHSRRYFLDRRIEHYRTNKTDGIKLSEYSSFDDLIEDRKSKQNDIINSKKISQDKKDKNTCQLKENSL